MGMYHTIRADGVGEWDRQGTILYYKDLSDMYCPVLKIHSTEIHHFEMIRLRQIRLIPMYIQKREIIIYDRMHRDCWLHEGAQDYNDSSEALSVYRILCEWRDREHRRLNPDIFPNWYEIDAEHFIMPNAEEAIKQDGNSSLELSS